MEIGKRLIYLRKERQLSQEELARQLNLSRGAIAMWETDKRKPDLDMLIHLADFFNVSIDYIMCRVDEDTISNSPSTFAEHEQKLLDTFRQLNPDNQDIIIGEIKKLLKEQLRDERMAQKIPLKKVD